ncbi:MAG TPA: hypothetical protein IAC28_04355 [Candidatus Aphodovivens excrementavium]|nr:hypothetical protein [Candidatus Aphodovivens excrementavium]
MKKSANGNIYDVAAREIGELYAEHLSGAPLPLVCVVSGSPLSPPARNALESSAASLGFGDNSCAFVVVEGADASLDANSLLSIVEGLDPLRLVAADASAAHLLSEAYRSPVPLDKPSRLMGRDAVAFTSFEAQLETSQNKQVAWALLKKLSRL